MTEQLAMFSFGPHELLGDPAPAPRFNPDAFLAGFRPNLPGVCCGHHRLMHEWGEPYGRCRFCDCGQFQETEAD